jgi:hypothetical protein
MYKYDIKLLILYDCLNFIEVAVYKSTILENSGFDEKMGKGILPK